MFITQTPRDECKDGAILHPVPHTSRPWAAPSLPLRSRETQGQCRRDTPPSLRCTPQEASGSEARPGRNPPPGETQAPGRGHWPPSAQGLFHFTRMMPREQLLSACTLQTLCANPYPGPGPRGPSPVSLSQLLPTPKPRFLSPHASSARKPSGAASQGSFPGAKTSRSGQNCQRNPVVKKVSENPH